jgi:hypothetical protein
LIYTWWFHHLVSCKKSFWMTSSHELIGRSNPNILSYSVDSVEL